MNQILKLIIICLLPLATNAQSKYIGFNAGVGISRADVSGAGRMFNLTGGRTHPSGLRISAQCGFGFFSAKGKAGGNDYIHSTHYGEVTAKIGYTFQLAKPSLNISPSIGLGIIAYDSRGEFTNANQGQQMAATFGSDYFVPKFLQFGPYRYCTAIQEYTYAFSPSICFEKRINLRLQIVLDASYSLLLSDNFDGYNFPIWTNTSNDHFWSITTGLHWNLYHVLLD